MQSRFNLVTMQGGHIQENGSASRPLDLQDVLPGGGSGFLLEYVSRLNDFLRYRSDYAAVQRDTYSCPVNSPIF